MAELKEKLGFEIEDSGAKTFMGLLEEIHGKMTNLGNLRPLVLDVKNLDMMGEFNNLLNKVFELQNRIDPILLSPEESDKYQSVAKSIRSITGLNKEILEQTKEQAEVLTDVIETSEKRNKKEEQFSNFIEDTNHFFEEQNKEITKSTDNIKILQKRAEKLAEKFDRYDMKVLNNALGKTQAIVDDINIELLSDKEFKKFNNAVNDMNRVQRLTRGNVTLLRNQASVIEEIGEEVAKRQKVEELLPEALSLTVEAKKKQVKLEKEMLKSLEKRLKLQGLSAKEAKRVAQETLKMEKAGKGAEIMKGAFKEIGGVLMKLAGPLAALLSIAAFADAMLDADERIKSAHKGMMQLGGSTAFAVEQINKFGAEGYLGTIEKMRRSQRQLWDEWGMGYEEAQENVKSLVDAGIGLDEVMGRLTKTVGITGMIMRGTEEYTMDLVDSVKTMSMISGKSFGEMAEMAGKLKEEYGKQISEIGTTFTRLREDATESGLVTNKFFDRVLNASSGMVIYGQKIDDVSALFRDLARNMRLPREQAAELAQELIRGADQFSTEQKILIADMGDIEGKFKEQYSELQKRINEARERGDLGIVASLSEELREMEKIDKVRNKMSRNLLMFEKLKPSSTLQAQIETLVGLVKGKGVQVDPSSVGSISKSFRDNLIVYEQIAKNTLGMSEKAWQGLRKHLGSFEDDVQESKSLANLFARTQTDNVKEQNKIITSLSDVFTKSPEEIAKALEETAVDVNINSFKKALADIMPSEVMTALQNVDKKSDALKIIAERIAKLRLTNEKLGEIIPDTQANAIEEERKLQAKLLTDRTKAVKQGMEEAANGALDGIYTGVAALVRRFTGGEIGAKRMEIESTAAKEAHKASREILNIEEDIAFERKKLQLASADSEKKTIQDKITLLEKEKKSYETIITIANETSEKSKKVYTGIGSGLLRAFGIGKKSVEEMNDSAERLGEVSRFVDQDVKDIKDESKIKIDIEKPMVIETNGFVLEEPQSLKFEEIPTVKEKVAVDVSTMKLEPLSIPAGTINKEERANVVHDNKTINISINGGDLKEVEKVIRQIMFEEVYSLNG